MRSFVSVRVSTRASYRRARSRIEGIPNCNDESRKIPQLYQPPHTHCRNFSETVDAHPPPPPLTTTTARRNKPIQTSWKRIANRLLDIPVGELTSVHWYEAQEALKTTTELPDSIASSWSVLDRLHQEAIHPRTKAKAKNGALVSADRLNRVVNSWRLCAARKASSLPLTSQEIMQRLESYSESGLVRPDVQTYTMIIDAIRYTEDPSRAPVTAESLLEVMLRGKSSSIRPNKVTISSILHLWSRSGLAEAPARVETHFKTLKEWYTESGSENFRPDERVYATVISTWAKSGHPHAGRRAAELLQEMKDTPDLEPNEVVYSAVLDALAKSGQADQARALLNEMLQLYAEGDTTVQPGVYSFSCVLAAYAKAGQAEAAEGVLQEMEALYEQTRDVKFRPNTICYSILIGAFAGSGEPRRAEAILQRMMESPYDSVKPNLVSFNQVLHAWAKSGDFEAVERATAILDRIELLHANGESPLKPDQKSYNNLLNCYANSPNPRKYAPLAQQKLEWMHTQHVVSLKPGKVSYNIVLRAWCKAGSPNQAESLLRDVSRLYRVSKNSIIAPHVDLFITVIAGWAVSKDPQAPQRVEALLKMMEDLHHHEGLETKPNKIAYNAFMDCLSRSKDPSAPRRAETVLRRMQDQWRAGVEGMKPDTVSFTSVITAWSRSSDAVAPERAEALFREMKESDDRDIQPNTMTYNSLMSTFSRFNRPFKVQTVFDEMEARYKAGDSNAAPNFPVYTTLLQAWAKAGEPARAGEVLAAMVRKFETGHLDRQPNTRSFNTVLQAWGRSTQLDAADKAEEGLDSMHSLATSGRLNVRPDLFTYSCAISAHVRAGRPDSAERAHKLLQRLKVLHAETGDAACRPDLRVYADMVCVWTNSHSPQAANRIEELFLELSQMGGPSWREQGLIACRRMLEALSNCPLPERVQLVERLVDVMCKNDIHLDAFMAKTVDRMMSSANGRHSAQ